MASKWHCGRAEGSCCATLEGPRHRGAGSPRRDLTSWNTNPWSPEIPAMELAGAGASIPPWPSSWTGIRLAPRLVPDPCRPCRTDTRRAEGFFRSAFLECKPRWKRLLCQAEQRCPSKSCSLCTVIKCWVVETVFLQLCPKLS